MEMRTQNGGGGSTGLLRALRDGGRPHAGEPEPREAPVLSLDQIRSVQSSNEYTEGPTVAPRPELVQALTSSPTAATSATEQQQLSHRSLQAQQPLHQQPAHFPRDSATRSASAATSEGSRSSARTSTSSTSSEQRLLAGLPAPAERIIRAQPPKRSELKRDELKPLAVAGADAEGRGKHAYRCEACGRCVCQECACPRSLPSCWTCGRRCLCSAQTAVDYGTCVCCVKGLFYHCSSDDEDVCTDKPFSCSQSHCCVRWSAMGVMALFLPCLLCYLPAKGCLELCQGCYDRAKRPGCRCKNTNVVHCKHVDKPT